VADPSFDTYSFDPDAGREGSYTFMRADGTARTVANTPYAAQLAADIDARKVKPAVDLTGPLPMPDPMAGMARAELGPRPAPTDMNAVVSKLEAVGKPAPAPMADAPDLMAMETGYRRQGPFDMRRFAVDGAPASGGETPWYDKPFNEGLKSMPVVGPVISQLATATRNTARVNFGIGVEPPSAPQVTPPLATPSANTGPDAEAQLLASQAPAPEPGTSEPGPMASMAPLAVSRAPAMSVAAPVAQEPAAPQAPLPASAVPVGRTVNPTQSAGQRIDAQIDRMMAPQFALAQRQGDVNEQTASGEADFAQDRAAIGLQRDEADAARRATQARREEQAYQSISRAADEVTAKQYDPDRYFKQRGPGAVVLASLAVAMGELGRGLQRTGGPNTALQIVNDAIERDLTAQREEYARAKDKLSLTSNAYAQLRQRGLDDEAAASQARAGALSAVAARAEAFRAGMKTDQAKLDADAAAQKLRDQADGMKAQARAQMAAQAAAAAMAQDKAIDKQLERAQKLANINETNSRASGSKELNVETRELAAAIAPLVQAREEMTPLRNRLNELPPGQTLPGYSMSANAVEMANSVVPLVNTRRILSQESNDNRNMVNTAFLAYRKAITGAGGSAEEMRAIEDAWKGAGTTEELRAAVNRSDAIIANVERRRRAGFSERANAVYDARGGAQSSALPTTATKVGP